MTATAAEIRELRRNRPRSKFLRASLIAVALLVAGSWLSGEFRTDDVFSARRLENASRFLSEIRPYPLQGRELDGAVALSWAYEIWSEKGAAATVTTLAIAIAAIVLAGIGAAAMCLPAARTFMAPDAFLPSPRPPSLRARATASVVVALARTFLIFVRAVPEYVWAFLLIASFGFSAWPAVAALALHNTGILGKLMAETVEDIEPGTARALRGLGGSRVQVALTAILPDVLPRFLLYFFYRWETCVREATVLGMLGVLSLGSLIRDARAANFYDEMVFFVLLGAGLVLVGDLVSIAARALVRHAS